MKRWFFCAIAILITLPRINSSEPFSSKDIYIHNTRDGIDLGATLSIPVSGNIKGAIVMATGSGAQNRDEEIMGHRPFKVIAEYLSSNGYAVLRMDDRGIGESSGYFEAATSTDFIEDILSGVNYLDSCYNNKPVGILGHSEGGDIAIRAAISDRSVDFIITLAAPAWSGDSIIMSQTRALATAATGRWDGESAQRQLLDIVKSDLSEIQLSLMLYSIISSQYGETARLPEVQKHISSSVKIMSSPHYREMVRRDPSADIRSVSVPWLAINGDRDSQVLPGNLITISQLNTQVDTVLLTGHNHLFQHCTTGMIQEYSQIAEDISEDALRTIISWLDKSVK